MRAASDRGTTVRERRFSRSLGGMITITEEALRLLQTNHAREHGMALELTIEWVTDAWIKTQLERFGNKFTPPNGAERWVLEFAGYFPEGRLPPTWLKIAPEVYVHMLKRDGPPFPGATIGVRDGKLTLELHAA